MLKPTEPKKVLCIHDLSGVGRCSLAVILPVAQVPPRLCYRNLFYTGVTRARKLCIVTGRRDVVNRMMGNVRQNLAGKQQALPAEQQKLEE